MSNSRDTQEEGGLSDESTLGEAYDAPANITTTTAVPDPTSEKDSTPEPPPNGGFNAWLQVAGSFFLFFNSWYVERCL